MSGAKDRRTKRALVNKDVVINGVIKAEALDISIDGMYVYTKSNFIPGTIFEITFKIGDETIKAMAHVQRSKPNVGVGIRLVDLSPENTEKIKKYVEG